MSSTWTTRQGSTFRRLVIIPRDLTQALPDCLYVGIPDGRDARQKPDRRFLLLHLPARQDQRQPRKRGDVLSGLVIINENMDLAEHVFRAAGDLCPHINEWYQSMQDAVIRQKSLQEIITLSEGIIGNFISISDSALTLVAYTKNITTDDPTSTYPDRKRLSLR